jgi:methanogenesis multiheme c-type cytochrome
MMYRKAFWPIILLIIFFLSGFIFLFRFTSPGPIKAQVFNPREVEESYHGQLGYGTDLGMLEKWCPLSNFSFAREGGIQGWIDRKCDLCHLGAGWNQNKPQADCSHCHPSGNVTDGTIQAPTAERCYSCHYKDTEKRGDLFTPSQDVHFRSDPQRSCQFCHLAKNHQIAKGQAIDTSEPTRTIPVLKCIDCHTIAPHRGSLDPDVLYKLNMHYHKVACETCHTDNQTRSPLALAGKDWTKFEGSRSLSQYHESGWRPTYKWYDGRGSSSQHKHVPILDYTERKGLPGARIYPFNVIRVTWFTASPRADLDEIIPFNQVKAAGKYTDPARRSLLVTTEEDMRAYDDPDDGDDLPDYPEATIVTREINFSLSHSIAPKERAPWCPDCHGDSGRRLLDWEKLGFEDGGPQID